MWPVDKINYMQIENENEKKKFNKRFDRFTLGGCKNSLISHHQNRMIPKSHNGTYKRQKSLRTNENRF